MTSKTARESLMLWNLNLVLKATVRGARDSRVSLLIGLCWHQARPTSTKTVGEIAATTRQRRQRRNNVFIRPGWARQGRMDHSYGESFVKGLTPDARAVAGICVGWRGGRSGWCATRGQTLIRGCTGWLPSPQDRFSS